jgi:hypothetical protein
MRGAAAGALAAAIWNGYDPLLKRVFGTPYADSEVLGPLITTGRWEWLANLVTHAAGGAAFGHTFERLGGRGVRAGVVAGVAENIALWPAVALIERVHPKAQNGEWPPLLLNGRAFAAATAGHAIFGVLLGLGVSGSPGGAPVQSWTKIGQWRSRVQRVMSAAGSSRRSSGAATTSAR